MRKKYLKQIRKEKKKKNNTEQKEKKGRNDLFEMMMTDLGQSNIQVLIKHALDEMRLFAKELYKPLMNY